MKWKEVSRAPEGIPDQDHEKQITAQRTEHYLVLDLWVKGAVSCRHAMDLETGEYGTVYPDDSKTAENLDNAAGVENMYWGYHISEDEWFLTDHDRKLICQCTDDCYQSGTLARINAAEEDRAKEMREKKKAQYENRIRKLSALCQEPGKEVKDWILAQAAGDTHYAFYDRETKRFRCTACGQTFPEKKDGKKLKNKETTVCPGCGSRLTTEKRRQLVEAKTRLTIIHNLDKKRGVERHFDVSILWNGDTGTRSVYLDEIIRLTLHRDRKHLFRAYYTDNWGMWREANRSNRRWKSGYLYPDEEGIRSGLEGTAYKTWSGVMPMLAQAGIEAHYNGLLVESNSYWTGIAEYLAKGRFYRLLKELSEKITYDLGFTSNIILISGKDAEEVLRLKDRQKINRLRQENGGINLLSWLQWSDMTGKKISQECTRFYEKAGMTAREYQKSAAGKYLSPEQLMHYLSRQIEESYKGMKPSSVLSQYEDYLDMAAKLGKHMDDPMVFRPRELKRRHDEAVQEMNRRWKEIRLKQNEAEARRRAEEMREKYPGYEELLEEISRKYEYSGDSYLIRVPRNFAEITAEGMALHHCVAGTERYFDRIVSRETYICFLRKTESPETPFYTIEVEPGGTIRQHRGAYDEEPDIEKIKPFLREWQQEIRRRMTREDHEHAAKSAVLRQRNIEELKEKNNTRVLNGLMEDLMEVI